MTPFQTRYYDFWTKFVQSKKYVRNYPIDFDKPFWHYIFNFKFDIGCLFLHVLFTSLFNPILIIFVTKAIIDNDFTLFLICASAKVLQQIIVLPFIRSYVYFFDNVENCFRISVQEFLLTTDPVNYSTKSTGEILAKIERTISAVRTFLGSIFPTILRLLTSILVAVGIIWQIDWKLGVVVGLFFATLCWANVKFAFFTNDIFTPITNKYNEEEKQYMVENITQNNYIRSTFATQEQIQGTNASIINFTIDNATKHRSWQWGMSALEIVLILGIFVILGFSFANYQSQTYLLVGVFTAMYNFYAKFYEIGEFAENFFKSIHNQQEFWQFMRSFGKQTFPVLDEKIKTNL
jgi:ABC-type multidrug transport system fused ATPase/permease subunit